MGQRAFLIHEMPAKCKDYPLPPLGGNLPIPNPTEPWPPTPLFPGNLRSQRLAHRFQVTRACPPLAMPRGASSPGQGIPGPSTCSFPCVSSGISSPRGDLSSSMVCFRLKHVVRGRLLSLTLIRCPITSTRPS